MSEQFSSPVQESSSDAHLDERRRIEMSKDAEPKVIDGIVFHRNLLRLTERLAECRDDDGLKAAFGPSLSGAAIFYDDMVYVSNEVSAVLSALREDYPDEHEFTGLEAFLCDGDWSDE